MVVGLGLLLVSSLVVHVEDASQTTPADVEAVAAQLAAAIGEQTRIAVIVDAKRGGCGSDREACVAEIVSRLGTEEVVFVRIHGAVRKMGIFVDRPRVAGRSTRAELSFDRALWKPALASVARALFPEQERSQTKVAVAPKLIEAVAPTPPVEEDVELGPYMTLGAGGALLVASGVLWMSAEISKGEVDALLGKRDAAGSIIGISYETHVDRYEDIGVRRSVGAVAAGLALTATLAGVVWLLASGLDEPG